MSDTHILSEKELNYIETLYLYANLQDFVSSGIREKYNDNWSKHWSFFIEELGGFDKFELAVSNSVDSDCYEFMYDYYYDTLLSQSDFLGFSNGRYWYDLKYCRIGIMDYDLAKKSNQFNVEIQYYQSHMFILGSRLSGLKLPFDGTLNQYHIKRIDLTKVVKTNHDYLTNYSFISPYRSIARFGNDCKTETVYLGTRKNGNVFRMYNKTIELQVDTKEHPIDYKKIEMFSKYFGNIENLYTFELELHRKYLKSSFEIDTLSDLDKIYKVYSEIVGKIKIYEDNDYNRNLIKNNHRDRIKKIYTFTEYIEYKRVAKKKYKPSESYLIDGIVKNINAYEKSLSVKMKEYEKINLIDKIVTSIFDSKDISIEINDDEDIIEYREFLDKVKKIRANQSDGLFKEANKAFSPIYAQNPKDLF